MIVLAAGEGLDSRLVRTDELVRVGVDTHLPQFLLDARIPKVLDLVVGAARQLSGDLRPSAKQAPGRSEACPYEAATETELYISTSCAIGFMSFYSL